MSGKITTITEPLSIKEIRDQVKVNDGFVKGKIRMSFGRCIDLGTEQFLDEVSEALVGSCLLMQVSAKVIGVDDDGDTLILQVSGDPSEILSENEGDE